MSTEIAITVENVSKNFLLPHEKVGSIKGLFTSMTQNRSRTKETQHALKDISFEIKKGEFFGIVGRNGSGKSTLLKILAGIYQPTSGRVSTRGKLVPFIELGVGFNPELTGRENVYLNGAMLGFSEKEIQAMYKDIVEFAELERFMDQKLKNYSSGMQVRLAFSMATRSEADILLIDEVLAVGDADFQRKCFDYFRTLKGSDTTVIFVTHDMNAVREYCERAILIEDSELIEEGPANKVAVSYTKMFIEEAKDAGQGDKQENRWGDRSLVYADINISTRKVTADIDTITLSCIAEAAKDIDDPVYGFLIKNAAHMQILGSNTLVAEVGTKPIKQGERVRLEWTIPNIFNDGMHYVDLAIVHGGGLETADWWEEAQAFKVLKGQKTPYIVSPRLGLDIKLERVKST